ncbi:MAG TPA: transposase [Chloroflexia bacterium]|nr:transposase [Chloroflexia bacterium]
MYQVLTAKLKLMPTPTQHAALRATQLAYRAGLNAASQYAFAHNKLSNAAKIHQGVYAELRAHHGLPAQLACSVSRQVAGTYKGLWTKCKQNAAHRKAGLTKKRYKGLDQPPKYVAPTLSYTEGRDYGFKAGQQVSLTTLSGRVVVPLVGYDTHLAWIKAGARCGAAKLWYDAPRKQFYLFVSLTVEIPDPAPDQQRAVVGVDVGVRYLAVTATPDNRQTFYSGRPVTARASHYHRKRKHLQQKGTRAATRRLRILAGRERRFKLDVNHRIARQIVTAYPQAVIGLELLTHIRERTNRRRFKKASRKQRRANRQQATWSFAELQAQIAYKAALVGSVAVWVDADYTSQACPVCGHTGRENRPNGGLIFACRGCGYRLHADLVGARNVALRTLAIRQDWVATGGLSTRPDVADREAKAARLQRWAELRQSPATSHPLQGVGR